MLLINCAINLDLSWSKNCILAVTDVANQVTTFSVTDTKVFLPVVTSSTQGNAKLLEQLKSGFKRTINWNKYQSKKSIERENQYLDYLIDPSFQGVNRLFVLSFEDEEQQTSYKQYYVPTLNIKDYNVMIDEQNLFDQPVRNDLITYDSIQKIATGQGDEYTTGCLLDYNYFKNYCKIIIDLSKQQALDSDPKAIQQITFAGNIEKNALIVFIIEETK